MLLGVNTKAHPNHTSNNNKIRNMYIKSLFQMICNYGMIFFFTKKGENPVETFSSFIVFVTINTSKIDVFHVLVR